ncbi:MAG: LamG-like jellyroll fold domain-containing protein, partial [Candidatus Eisenbacteria bacterium]
MSGVALHRGFVSLALACALLAPTRAAASGYYSTGFWGSFGLTLGIALDASSNVYVTDLSSDFVKKFDAEGNFLLQWNIGHTPYAVVTDGDYVYVTDSVDDKIMKFTSEGVFVLEWGAFGTANGQMRTPIGLAVGPDHTVYVSDLENHRVQKFTPTGEFLGTWGSVSWPNGSWSDIRGLAVGGDGTVYIAGGNAARVSVYTSDGTFIRMFGAGILGRPTDVDLGPDGNLYIPDEALHVVWLFTPTGDLIESFGSFGTNAGQMRIPRSLAVNAANQIYVAEYLNGRVQRWAPCPFPAFTVQPEPQSLAYGGTATFSVTAPNAVDFQWFHDNVVLSDVGGVHGANTATLTIANFQAADLGSYWCDISNICGQSAESDHVALTQAVAPSCFGPPAPPPAGMAAWWAMDPGPGRTTPDVLHPVGNKNHATLTGAAALVAGKVGAAVRCNGVNDGLHVPSTLCPRLAAASTGLSIDAWVLPRSGSSANAYRMILQKGLLKKHSFSSGGVTALAPGYAFYLKNGRMGFQMPDPDYEPVTFEPAMAAMTMDEWHHVAVTIEPQVVSGGRFYLDGVQVASFTPPSGILDNLADLYIGRFTPQLGPATPDSAFNGDIDEVELFVTAIDSSAVRRIWSAGCTGKERVQVLTNDVTIRQSTASAEVCFAIQNLSPFDRHYSWSIAASAPAAGCASAVPVTFTPSSGNLVIPAGERVDLSSAATVPTGALATPFTRCYEVAVTDLDDDVVIPAGATLSYTGHKVSGRASCTPPEVSSVTPLAFAAEGGNGTAIFTVFNDNAFGVTLPYSIRTRDPLTDGPSGVLRLEGQAPGLPWSASAFIPAGGVLQVPVDVTLDEYEPFPVSY